VKPEKGRRIKWLRRACPRREDDKKVEVCFGSQSSLAARKRLGDNLFGCGQLMVSRSPTGNNHAAKTKGTMAVNSRNNKQPKNENNGRTMKMTTTGAGE
jgi:hypothetical protein